MSVSTIPVGHAIEDQWRSAFFETVTRFEIAEPLRDASVHGDYRAWTTALTAMVVATCEAVGCKNRDRRYYLGTQPESGRVHWPVSEIIGDSH